MNPSRLFGRLYDSDIEGIDEFVPFQSLLDRYDSNATTGIYDSRRRLKMLAPQCDSVLVKCRYGGKDYKCSDILVPRRTSEGYCCAFNFIRNMEK